MLGAIVGDFVGSIYEFHNTKDYDFTLLTDRSTYTDDSVMTVAVAKWLLTDPSHSLNSLAAILREFGRNYPCPMGGYGDVFWDWLKNPQMEANDSFGNGSAMRASAVGWMFDSLEETERVARLSAVVSHKHPEGIKGAQATAAAVFLARTGKSKEEIKSYIEQRYGYNLDRNYEQLKKNYHWESGCQGTVPEAIIAFLHSKDYEDSIRLSVALGGDSDTLACINGGIAEAFYGVIPEKLSTFVLSKLPNEFKKILGMMRTGSFYHHKYVLNCISDEYITDIKENEIFVFGSDENGQHLAGASSMAINHFGAVMGQGVGLQGQSYAIPTLNMSLDAIREHVDEFIQFAKSNPKNDFLVTRIGCGYARYNEKVIAPLFKDALLVENIFLPKSFLDVLNGDAPLG